MHYCQHSVPVNFQDYLYLPDINGIITPAGMDAFLCGRPAGIRLFDMWLCADHADAMDRGRRLNAANEEP